MTSTLLLIVALLVIAMVLILVEICTPIFGLLGLLAVCAAGWAVYLAYTVDGTFGIALTVAAVVGYPVYMVLLVKLLPKTRLGSLLYLGREPVQPGEGTPEADKLSHLVGRKTTAETHLRPSGMVRIDGNRIVAQAESGMIEQGAEVRVISSAGTHVVVRKIEA